MNRMPTMRFIHFWNTAILLYNLPMLPALNENIHATITTGNAVAMAKTTGRSQPDEAVALIGISIPK